MTLGATAVSTYALDAFATAAGVLLLASHVLRDLDHGLLLIFLGGTYLLWGAGLRVNLQANWRLLEATGTSTNALSKVAHDVVKLRTASLRAQRMASAIGYVGTELAKEAPYYAGAFGAVALSDSISSHDALVFLGGTNLGAAAYEYGLARMTRAFLHIRLTQNGSNPPSVPSWSAESPSTRMTSERSWSPGSGASGGSIEVRDLAERESQGTSGHGSRAGTEGSAGCCHVMCDVCRACPERARASHGVVA
jgi:hypothetical protein